MEAIILNCVLKELLEQRGKTVYWLMKQTGMSQKSTYDLVNNHTNGIKFDTLEKICLVLECTPNDVLRITRTID